MFAASDLRLSHPAKQTHFVLPHTESCIFLVFQHRFFIVDKLQNPESHVGKTPYLSGQEPWVFHSCIPLKELKHIRKKGAAQRKGRQGSHSAPYLST